MKNYKDAEAEHIAGMDRARAARVKRVVTTDKDGLANPTSRVKYDNKNAKRFRRVTPKVMGQIDASVSAGGLTAKIFSGGQKSKSEGTGTHRHNHGNAADISLFHRGTALVPTNPKHQKHIAKFIEDAVSNGATGIGVGKGYMTSTNGIHVGYNPKDFSGVWGKDGDKDNAPLWAKEAYRRGKARAAKRK